MAATCLEFVQEPRTTDDTHTQRYEGERDNHGTLNPARLKAVPTQVQWVDQAAEDIPKEMRVTRL
jgi:hypothetical protein